ncbi:MAG: hypothetical protein ACTHU0_39010 [Kofleriaceae bacterium]
MNVDKAIEIETRNQILRLLSDTEAEGVATAETHPIPAGEEFLDLEHLERGVQRAEPATRSAHTIPRTAVSDSTWQKILAVLATPAEPRKPPKPH